MTDTSLPGYIPPPTRRDWIAILSAILGAFMAILDIQIINSSLKDIQGALSATVEEGSWISTSYLVAEIIVIPLAAWLAMVLSLVALLVIIGLYPQPVLDTSASSMSGVQHWLSDALSNLVPAR